MIPFTSLPPLCRIKQVAFFGGSVLSVLMVAKEDPDPEKDDTRFFIEKFADIFIEDGKKYNRTIVVNVPYDKITAYEQQKMTMMELLLSGFDVGYVLDYCNGKVDRVFLIQVSTLPANYLPNPDEP